MSFLYIHKIYCEVGTNIYSVYILCSHEIARPIKGFYEISVSHGGEDVDVGLLGCNSV
jgi:hypothetical protein